MKVHKLVQGVPEWHQFRLTHDGASEAAAMLGLSTKVTRTELLTAKKTGIAREFSDWVQERVLDHGHAVEALARPIIERIIGEDLYPITASNEDIGGKQSASCDGLTISRKRAFEHKQWNEALAAAVRAKELPEEYMPQCQQVCKITGAEEVIFTVSDGTEDRMEYMVVPADPEWFARLDAGWAQFERDLANHVPPVVEVKAVGKTPDTMPALRVEVTGMVTASNIDAYKEHAIAVIDGINRNLVTDQDFADAAKIVKWCGDVEDRLEQVKEHALSQTATIDVLFKAIDDIKAKARATRLDLDKLVTKRNTERKEEIVLGGKTAYQAHLDGLKAETDGLWITLPTPDFAGSIKGMRLFSNMQDAVNTLLANSKITADDSAKKIRGNLALLAGAADHAFLFNDRAQLVAKAADDLKLLIQSRITEHKAAKQKEADDLREKIQAEEKAKAEKEAEDRQAAINASALGEIQGIQQQVIIASTGRIGVRKGGTIECIRETLAETEAWVIDDRFGALKGAAQSAKDNAVASIRELLVAAEAPAPAPATVTPPSPAVAAITHAQVVQQMPAAVRQAMAPKPAAKPETAPTLTLGEISTRLSFNVTSAFLATLGFEATTVKAAKLYHSDDFTAICEAIKTHISEVQDQFEPATA